YRTDSPVDANPDFKPATRPISDPKNATSAEQRYVEGVAFDKKSKEGELREAYKEALRRDQEFAPVHIALALSLHHSGEYAHAASIVEAALARSKDFADAHYFLALVRRAMGQYSDAEDHLSWLVRSGQRESLSRYLLGQLALAKKDYPTAVEQLQQSVM